MKSFFSFRFFLVITIFIGAGVVWLAVSRFSEKHSSGIGPPAVMPVAVEVDDILRGSMEDRRTFSGALESHSKIVVSPKVSGRIERLYADIGDSVEKGQIISELDDDEYVQAVAQAEADLLVANANLKESENALEIADRELTRFETLRARGVASDSQLDAARADQLSKEARREVARAQVIRSDAMLETARIRLGYTRIKADWIDEKGFRTVAERFADEGGMVAAGDPLLSIVDLDPMIAVIFVTEKDYAGLHPGQTGFLTTDAFPDSRFTAEIMRIAPIFGTQTRQARIELGVDNPRHLLKPGMFIRVTIVLERVDDALMVPEAALTHRDDQAGVFVVGKDHQRVFFRPVTTGIRADGRIQILADELFGQVVVLGQQLLNDGAAITLPEKSEPADPSSVQESQGP